MPGFAGSLTRCFVEKKASSDGGVKAFYLAWSRDGDTVRRIGEKDFAETRALVADEKGARASQRRFADGSAFACDGGNGGDVMAVEEVERFRFGCIDGGHTEGGAGRSAESLGVPGACGARQQQNTTCGEGFGRSEKRADVAGILQPGEDEDQWSGCAEDSV